MAIIDAQNVKYEYEVDIDKYKAALMGIDLQVGEGEFVCILGHNGSGKSTFAKHINALLTPSEGVVYVDGVDTKNSEKLWEIRSNAGMVFQNPDNQIVSSIVEEDVAFGPENLGMPREEIIRRVKESLEAMNMTGYERRSPSMLSGGQKQRVAIAGVLAMSPKIIVFDEPTAMLDPSGRKEVTQAIRYLNKELKKTVVLITHYMDEAVDADRLYVLNKGKVVTSGTPREVFSRREIIKESGLSLPFAAQIYEKLKEDGIDLGDCPIKNEELVEKLCQLL